MGEKRQISYALTDVLLSTAAFTQLTLLCATSKPLLSGTILAQTGLGIIGLAALLGTLRFGISSAFRPFHDLFTHLSASVGMPVIGLNFAILSFPQHLAAIESQTPQVFLGVLAVGLSVLFVKNGKAVGAGAGGAVAAVLLLLSAVAAFPNVEAAFPPLLGVLLSLLGTVAQRSKVRLFGLKGIDTFHILFAAALVVFRVGLTLRFEQLGSVIEYFVPESVESVSVVFQTVPECVSGLASYWIIIVRGTVGL